MINKINCTVGSYLLVSLISGVCAKGSNVIVILTDDQDLVLNSLQYLPKISEHLVKKGTTISNAVS